MADSNVVVVEEHFHAVALESPVVEENSHFVELLGMQGL